MVTTLKNSWKTVTTKSWLALVLGVGLSLMSAASSRAVLSPAVSCAWDASADANVVGYFFYYNTNSADFTTRVDIGTNTVATVDNLSAGGTYYFAVTAYTVEGVESAPSSLIQYVAPGTPPSSNEPPVLAPIANQTVDFGGSVAVTNTDSASNLTFSLVSGPAGMTVNAATGVISWTPTLAQSGSVNAVTVRVSDNQTPPQTASQTFNVTVGDTAQIGLTNATVAVGQAGSLPVTLFSSGAVTNLSFILAAPADWINSVSVKSLMNGVTVTQTSAGPAQALITVQTTNGVTLKGQLNLLQIDFTTVAGQAPGTDSLQVSNVTATLATGKPVAATPDASAEISFIVTDATLNFHMEKGVGTLTLYGPVGNKYEIQSTTDAHATGGWKNEFSTTLTNSFQSFGNLSTTTNAMKFYRAHKI